MYISPVRYLLVLVILFLSLACEREPTSWRIEAAGPLLNTKLGLGNLIADSLLSTGPDNAVAIVYEDTILEYDVDTIAEFDADTLDNVFSIFPISQITINPGQTFFTSSDQFDFTGGEVLLSNALIRQGTYLGSATSTIGADLILSVLIPRATLNGDPLEINITIPAAVENSPGSISFEEDLVGYFCDLSGENANGFNVLEVISSIKLADYEEPTTITNLDEINLKSFYENLLLSEAYGYLGNDNTEINDRVSFLDLGSFSESIVNLSEVKANLKITNGFGVDIATNIFELTAFNSFTQESVSLNHQFIGSNINLNRATLSGDELNTYPRIYEVNGSNSNIIEFFELLADSLIIAGNAELNPLGNISNFNDFIVEESSLVFEARIEIPLTVSISNLAVSDTIEVSWSQDDFDPETALLYLFAENSFPADGLISLKAFNAQNELTLDFSDLLDGESDELIRGREGDEGVKSVITYRLSAGEVDELIRADKILLEMDFETVSYPGLVEIRANDSLRFVLATELTTLIEF
jgi:hypothetical protein